MRREARDWFDSATLHESVVSSRLLQTELTRVLRREGMPVSARANLLDYIGVVPLSDKILVLAESIAQHVKTLDAIHLASALRIGDVTVVSHDANMLAVAADLGLPTLDPLASAA